MYDNLYCVPSNSHLIAFCLLKEEDVEAELSGDLAVDDSRMVLLTCFLKLVGVSQICFLCCGGLFEIFARES